MNISALTTPVRTPRRVLLIAVAVSVCLGHSKVARAAAIPPCGTFEVTHEEVPGDARANDGNPFHGQHVTITFKFDPSRCHATCTCNRIAFVQVVKFIRWDGGATVGTDFQVDPWQTGRCTGDPVPGWAVDKLSAGGRRYGFYARKDDGSFPPDPAPFVAEIGPPVELGSNDRAAVLFDTPGLSTAVANDFGFFAITAPVCIDEQSECRDSILGHVTWGFRWNGVYHWIKESDSPVWLLVPFDKAVECWNAQNDPGEQVDLTLRRLGSES
jgi:hypothetical protein